MPKKRKLNSKNPRYKEKKEEETNIRKVLVMNKNGIKAYAIYTK